MVVFGLQVARSNTGCKLFGYNNCLLNFERDTSFNIAVEAWDTGFPSLSVRTTLTLELQDINDAPRNLNSTGKRFHSVLMIVDPF